MSHIPILTDAMSVGGSIGDAAPHFGPTPAAVAGPERASRTAVVATSLSRMLGGAGDALLVPRALPLLLCGSFAVAMAFCFLLLPVQFLSGASAYWRDPRGLVGGSWADISTALSGYEYFVRGSWTLPLFQTAKLGVPHPVNIIFTDSIPIVALLGRLLYRATGADANPYGAWAAFCFVGSAMSLTALVAVLGQRGIAAALAATVTGLCMPALLYRWGHMSLMAQWEITLALLIYAAARRPSGRGSIAAAILLQALSLWTHTYLFVMVSGILAATLAQLTVTRRIRVPQALAIAGLSLGVAGGMIAVSGYLATGGSLDGRGYGVFSFNPFSPLVPQFSLLSPNFRKLPLDVTGGQYEGFSYLGGGMLLLLSLTLPWLWRRIARSWRDHICLLALLSAFLVFATSDCICIGSRHVLTVPLPAPLLVFAGMFRSSGRFVWPALYMLTAAMIVITPLVWGRRGAWLLLAVAALQFVDTIPLQTALAERVAAPASEPLPEAVWLPAIQRHHLLRVFPTFACIPPPHGKVQEATLELQSLASREDVATNTVYAARHAENCAPGYHEPLAANELRVYLPSALPPAALPANWHDCAGSSALVVCSRTLPRGALASLAASWR